MLKALDATAFLLPSAILKGGTLPLIGQDVIRARGNPGQMGSAPCAVNTAGGATGALSAGFFLRVWLACSRADLSTRMITR
ncbi:MAG: hypothetical protein EA386_13975 [Rhodobacteraceae bacterium]|nr:MAG: hypothetical protein EA386_13975 [Paracoccaceae bacterium]